MGNSFLVAFNIIIPMALMMGVGIVAKKTGLATPEVMRKVDNIAFKIFLPTLLFKNIYDMDISQKFDLSVALLSVAAVALLTICAVTLPKLYEKDHNKRASIAQAIIRTNYVLFGLVIANSIYPNGDVGYVAIVGAIIIPLTNALTVLVLEKNRANNASFSKILLSVIKNPMVIATLLALLLAFLKIKLPATIYSTIKDLGAASNPVCFLSLGVALEFKRFSENRKSLFFTILIKSVIMPVVLIGSALLCGFRGTQLCAFMVLGACPTAVSSYPLAVAMDADGQTAAQLVCLTTVVSLFTLFLSISGLTYLQLL